VIRGIASIANEVTFAVASALFVRAEVSGARWPIRTWPFFSFLISAALGRPTLATTSAFQATPIFAPASL
jgi:hypothetical protein